MDSIVSVLIISVKVDGAIPHGVSDRTTAPDPETQRALHWTGKNELPQCGAFSYSPTERCQKQFVILTASF